MRGAPDFPCVTHRHGVRCPGGGLAPGPTMRNLVNDRGVTLIETLLAASLLFTLAGGVAHLLLLTRQLAVGAEQVTAAIVAASARIERIRAVPWHYGLDGSVPEVAAIAVSPSGTLERDTEGFYEVLDAAGRPLEGGSTDRRMVCRWAIVPASGGTPDLRGIEACVFAWPAGDGARPLVCLASARGRQP
jgi:hypothetical protein